MIYGSETISDDIRTIIEPYDPRTRPWYQPIAQDNKPRWSSIYANADERQDITLSAMTPIYEMGEFAGVLVTDVRINTFNLFLQKLKQDTNASVYIMDQEQRLVAHSGQGSVISWGTKFSDKGQRLFASESADPVIQMSAARVSGKNLSYSDKPYTFEFDFQRSAHL
ncbi:cache domain-containing protein [Vibrio harveyi]|nr:cache domain-containing protein [Vibrio harveyi]